MASSDAHMRMCDSRVQEQVFMQIMPREAGNFSFTPRWGWRYFASRRWCGGGNNRILKVLIKSLILESVSSV